MIINHMKNEKAFKQYLILHMKGKNHMEIQLNRQLSVFLAKDELPQKYKLPKKLMAKRERKKITYDNPEHWRNYNLYQTSEKLMFLGILKDLIECVCPPEKQKKERGRPSTKKEDLLYCMTLLTYCCKSSRRIISEFHMVKDRNMISQIPTFNTTLRGFNSRILTKKLMQLCRLSTLPLREVEQSVAVDSTGFSTSLYETWYDHKWGEAKPHRKWVKAHIAAGIKTKIITAIEISEGTAHDCSYFMNLVGDTCKDFQLREVCADRGYLSRDNFEFASQQGLVAYIPFKSNSIGKSRGSLIWHRMFVYFNERQEEFMAHYHKRSNVESAFSMIKRKFNNHLRSKSKTAQINEILCKVLCHNISVLITQIFELGIDTEFKDHIDKLKVQPFSAS